MLPGDAVLDGEVVVLGQDGRPSFQALQQRAQVARPEDVAHASVERPATLFAFDLLSIGGLDLRPLPLADRKRVLSGIVPRLGPVRFADHVEARGEDLWREVEARGLEGIVAKRADAPYRSGVRSAAWRKVRALETADLAVVGFTRPRGARAAFGALLLAAREGDAYVFAGSVGSGFTDRQLADLHARLARRVRKTPPCAGPVPKGRGNTWVEPEVVVEVRFTEWTGEGLLRHPVFLRVRDDKRPEETGRERGPARRARRRRPRSGGAGGRRSPGAGRAGGARVRGDERGQGLVPGRRDHEGRRRRVLPRHRAVHAAVPEGPPARADALP